MSVPRKARAFPSKDGRGAPLCEQMHVQIVQEQSQHASTNNLWISSSTVHRIIK